MIARSARSRSGITLTEILISILIMGIGLVSLATLFPLGLVRLRDASRFQRGTLLAQSSSDDFGSRALLFKPSFTQTWYGPRDPFTLDFPYGNGNNAPVSTSAAVNGRPLPGLTVCYDPLWRAITNVVPPTTNKNNALYDPTLTFVAVAPFQAAEARFGDGVVSGINPFGLRTTLPGDSGSPPSAYGLQRITNFIPWLPPPSFTSLYPFTHHNNALPANVFQAVDVAADTFTSIDDVVFNSAEGATIGSSPLLPDLTLSGNGSPSNDWKYTWFFTGRQVDSTNGQLFQGDIVICDGRQFVFAPLPAPNNTTAVPIGETVVEAVFGYSTNVNVNANGVGYAVGGDRSILLRWPTTLADPSLRVGGWIADVTYERNQGASTAKLLASQTTPTTGTSFQRCNWYQIVKRTDAQADPVVSGYRQMILTTSSPVRAKTLLQAGGQPYFLNVALVMPSVINVFPRSFEMTLTNP